MEVEARDRYRPIPEKLQEEKLSVQATMQRDNNLQDDMELTAFQRRLERSLPGSGCLQSQGNGILQKHVTKPTPCAKLEERRQRAHLDANLMVRRHTF